MLNPAVFPSAVSRVSAIWQNMQHEFLIYAKGGVREKIEEQKRAREERWGDEAFSHKTKLFFSAPY